MKKLLFLILTIVLLISSCIRTNSKKNKTESAENELLDFLTKNGKNQNNLDLNYHPKDTIDYSKMIISKDSVDIALFNLLAGHDAFSDLRLIENIEILVNKGADPNAIIEYQYSVRKAGTYIPIIKHFYRNKYRTHSANSTSFLEAVNSDKLIVVEKMISLKSDVNKPSKSAVFPIDIALRNNNKKMIDLLLANGCKAVFANLSVCEDIDLIEKLVELGADKNTIDINFALENENALMRILKLSPDINNSELDYRVIFTNEKLLDILLEAGLNNSSRGKFPDNDPLIFGAIKYGDLNTIKKLDAAGVDIMYRTDNHTSNSPFLTVIKSQQIDLINYYIEKGANPNEKDWTKKSALIIAVGTDNDEVIKLLIKAGANKEYSGYFNKTPLMQSVDYDKYISAQTLINEKANLNYKNKYHESCLSIAIEESNFPMIKLLIESGADSEVMFKKMNMAEYAKSVDAPNMIIEYLENIE